MESRIETSAELLTPREAAEVIGARFRIPRMADRSTREIWIALTRLGVRRIPVGWREWRVSRTSLERAIETWIEAHDSSQTPAAADAAGA